MPTVILLGSSQLRSIIFHVVCPQVGIDLREKLLSTDAMLMGNHGFEDYPESSGLQLSGIDSVLAYLYPN